MKTNAWASLVASALVLGAPHLGSAQNARFRYLVSIYADTQAIGLHLPEGVACGADGQIVVGDTGNSRLVRFAYRDNRVSGGSVIEISQLKAPVRVQLNSKGEIYALDALERRIVHLSPEGEFKDMLSMEGVPPPSLIVPKTLAIDSLDQIHVLDAASARVLVLDPQGKFQRGLSFPEDIGFGSELAVEEGGRLLLLDSIKRRMFSADKDASAFTQVGGDLSGALATMPTYLMTSKGSTFVAEGRGSSIVTFRRDGSFMARQLTLGREEGSLDHPSQMCINDQEVAFIADRDNSRIQVFQLIR